LLHPILMKDQAGRARPGVEVGETSADWLSFGLKARRESNRMKRLRRARRPEI
jgi:hypothetical protein